MIKCCIFDLDGTILDTITTITYYVNLILERNGVRNVSEDECKYFVGEGARKLITRALNSRGVTDSEKIEKMLAEYNRAYNSAPVYLTKPFEGIAAVLSSLKKRGIKLAVLSNKPNEATVGIVEHFFGGIFDSVSGGIDSVPLKPDPSAALEIIKKLGISASETAFIGDTSTDMKTGKNLGVRLNIGVLWGFRKRDELLQNGADTVISEVSDILTEVERIA